VKVLDLRKAKTKQNKTVEVTKIHDKDRSSICEIVNEKEIRADFAVVPHSAKIAAICISA
jgi:hypothetical protein